MTKKAKKSSNNKKATYRLRNWSAYNKSLVQRGSITVWINQDVIDNWHPDTPENRSRGGQYQYSDQAIKCVLLIKAIYRLPYRQSVGFTQSVMDMLGAQVIVPDYSTVCKRSRTLSVEWETGYSNSAKHIVMDSSGLKIYGEGEWKVRQHGYSKRRTWRKLHLSVNADTHEVEAVVLSQANVDDAQAGQTLLEETSGNIEQVDADGSYDKRKFYDASQQRGIKNIIVPPRKDAKIWQHGNTKAPPLPRDENLRYIRRHGRKKWKRDTHYHRRSLAETAVFRFKIIFGNSLASRTLQRQVTEARIKVVALNRMTRLGMPDTYRLA